MVENSNSFFSNSDFLEAKAQKKAVVWLKKDLRLTDHRPFFEASKHFQQIIALYIYEPEWFQSYEFDESHLIFLNQSLLDLQKQLAPFNIQLVTRFGSAVDVFQKLRHEFNYSMILAHQETGVAWTFARDIQLIQYCKTQAISFKEYYQFAVVRRLKNRNDWNHWRTKIIERKIIPLPRAQAQLTHLPTEGLLTLKDIIQKTHFSLQPTTVLQVQKGGAVEAHRVLKSFLNTRAENYLKHISDPWYAQESSSRLSPYITFGNISISEIHHALRQKEQQFQLSPFFKKSLWAFENRLWWHCHFIQKLESEFEIEFENVNRAFDGLRESEFRNDYFEAWKNGETGYPLIDATMRCLKQTGWINFRMRAMLVSFASYQLWLHWKKPAEYLAKYFLDFEPGIHFSQFQMQSGVTGINAIRIYNPIKQAHDQKGSAQFIKKFVPELLHLSDEGVFEPEALPPLLLLDSGLKLGETYPKPIVEHKQAYDLAKQRIFEWRGQEAVKKNAQKVLKKHASRKIQSAQQRFPEQNREVPFGNFKKTEN